MGRIERTTISIVTSALNEEECLPELFSRLEMVALSESKYEFSLIVIDNGSSDRTWDFLVNYKKSRRSIQVTAIRMSRTFPFDAALTCGLDYCDTDIAVIMTSDLQDPPEEIPRMLRLYEEGFDQVVARVRSRDSVPFLRRVLTSIFYKLANRLTSGVIMDSVSDFRLASREVYYAMRSLRESHRFNRGFGSWVGFNTTSIDIFRPARFGGESKWLGTGIGKVISKSLSSILAFSTAPLSFIALVGYWTSSIAFLSTVVMAISWFAFGVPFAGFGTIVGIVLLGFSIILLFLGVLSQYLALIYEEVKLRPLYITKNVLH